MPNAEKERRENGTGKEREGGNGLGGKGKQMCSNEREGRRKKK